MKVSKQILYSIVFITLIITSCKKDDGPKTYDGNIYNPTIEELQYIYEQDFKIINGNVTFNEYSGKLELHYLSKVESITNGLFFYSNDQLTSLNGLSSLRSVMNGLFIKDNSNLLNLNGIQSLLYLRGVSLIIENNEKLNDISGIRNLVAIEHLGVLNNDSLTNLFGLENIPTIGTMVVSNNISLVNFCSLTDLVVNNNIGSYKATDNAFNPTLDDIIEGNCSQ